MSLQAVEQVLETEQRSKERRTTAEQQAKQMVDDAERNGLALLHNVSAEAETEGRALMQQAEKRAEERAAAIDAEARRQADALRAAAKTRIEQAAERIVERVVR